MICAKKNSPAIFFFFAFLSFSDKNYERNERWKKEMCSGVAVCVCDVCMYVGLCCGQRRWGAGVAKRWKRVAMATRKYGFYAATVRYARTMLECHRQVADALRHAILILGRDFFARCQRNCGPEFSIGVANGRLCLNLHRSSFLCAFHLDILFACSSH